jgi:hypothetical protein
LPRDERGCVNEEVVKNLVVADDYVPRYVVGPYLRISEYKVYHAHNVASYAPEYLDNFGVFIDRIMGYVNQTGARTIFLLPFPW